MATLHFMPEAADHVRGMDRLDGHTLMMGADRVRAAMNGVNPATGMWAGWSDGRAIGDAVLGGKYVEPEGTASFLAAALICAKAANPKLTGKFAYTEAVYAKHVLEEAVVRRRGRASSLLAADPACDLDAVCREILGVEPGADAGTYTLPVGAYLKLATGLGRSWKLVNQAVNAGLVSVEPDDFVRLLRDAITAYIRKRITGMKGLWTASGRPSARGRRQPPPNIEVPADIAEWCARMVESPPAGDAPPCVEQCCSQMDKGINLQHDGRYLVAAFYIHAGEDDDTIGGRFTGAPDYNANITGYQIRQIRGRGYGVPSCRWVASRGLCPGCAAAHPTRYKKPATP